MSQAVHSQMMVEVFKTNIDNKEKAELMIREIQKEFVNCRATIDLEDCDRVLVVRSLTEGVDSSEIIELLFQLGCKAEVLPDF